MDDRTTRSSLFDGGRNGFHAEHGTEDVDR
jgi:hypothetical protein